MVDFWRNRRVLVTGATGFIGRWTVQRLARCGATVAAIARSMPRRADGDAVYYAADVTNVAEVSEVLRDHLVDTVLHLAGQPITQRVENPIPTLVTNIQGTWSVLQAALEHNVTAVIGVSSAAIYAPALTPLAETDSVAAGSPYAASKMCSETLFSMYASTYGMRTGMARFANVFGGGDETESRLIPGAIRAAFTRERLQIRSHGATTLDFLYIEDAVDALLKLGECVACGIAPSGEVYNFSLEQPISILDVIERIARIVGRDDLVQVIPPASPPASTGRLLDCAKARRVLGWTPLFTFNDGLQATVDWHRSKAELASEPRAAALSS